MSRRAYTEETHGRLLEAFRAQGGRPNFNAAARVVGCQNKTARRAYMVGWPEKGMPPITTLLEDERLGRRALAFKLPETAAARQVLRALEDAEPAKLIAAAQAEAVDIRQAAQAELDKAVKVARTEVKKHMEALLRAARADVVETQAAEIALTRNMRGLVLQGVNFARLAFTQETFDALARAARDALAQGQISWKDARSFMYAYATFVRHLAEAGRTVMEMERLRIGNPTEGVPIEVDEVTPAEAVVLLEHAASLAIMLRDQAPDGAIEILPQMVEDALPPDGQPAEALAHDPDPAG